MRAGAGRRHATSSQYLFLARPHAPSVLDILAGEPHRGGLPPAPVSEQESLALEEAARSLPGVYAGQGEQMEGWAQVSFDGYVVKGQAHLRKKDYTGAQSSFGIARTIAPDRPRPRIGLIQTALLVGHHHRARRMIRDLCRRTPGVFATRFDVVKWHESEEQYEEFLRGFRQQFIGRTHAGVTSHILIGYVAWTTGNREQALNQMKQAAAKNPREEGWVKVIKVLELPSKAERPAPTTTTSSVGSPAL